MSNPPSPIRAVMALAPRQDPEWQPILQSSNQVVLYNPKSHALTISQSSATARPASSVIATRHPRLRPCPYCKQELPNSFDPDAHREVDEDDDHEVFEHDTDPAYQSRAANYFQLLAISNETTSRPSSPPILFADEGATSQSAKFQAEQMAEGYFQRFFQEEFKLGMGANGSVFLCQHVLDGNPLGHFAVKKIAVGESHSYLLKILREVRLLESLHHPNIVTYHHSWLETSQFSSFGPRVPTLHVLMQWAEGGSLDDFIDIRQGKKPSHPHIHPVPNHTTTSRFEVATDDTEVGPSPQLTPAASESEPETTHSRSARIRAFRAYQRASPQERERMVKQGQGPNRKKDWAPIHLLSADEVKSLFQDVVEGLGFLHGKSILHLDLKPGNVLLTWDDGKMIPRAMLSDFGTSRDMMNTGRFDRSGNTGTLEYTSPESLPSPETGLLRQIDSKSDMWSLGMILHKMLFFKLPYKYASEGDANGEPISLGPGNEGEKMNRLESEVLQYPGFKATPALVTTFEARRLPRAFLVLLESLLNKTPAGRPSCDRVVTAVREGKLDPLREVPRRRSTTPDALVPVRKLSQSPPTEPTVPESIETPEVGRPIGLLPSSSDILGPHQPSEKEVPAGWFSKASLKRRWDGGTSTVASSRAWKQVNKAMKSKTGRILMRMLKSYLLVSKALSVWRLCPEVDTYPRHSVMTALMGVAIMDTVIDVEPWHRGLLVTAGLAALHSSIVTYGTRSGLCCAGAR